MDAFLYTEGMMGDGEPYAGLELSRAHGLQMWLSCRPVLEIPSLQDPGNVGLESSDIAQGLGD